MSTNSTIKISRKDGSITGIYCHWDGYIEYNGVLLQLYYNTAEKVEELLKLGNISSLGKYTEPTMNHSFDKPQEDVTVAYHRDRGEDLHFIEPTEQQEYNYIFDEAEGIWLVEYETYNDIISNYVNNRVYVRNVKTKFLIDEIMSKITDIENMWDDEESLRFKLLNNAETESKKALKEKADEYDSWYHAYCD